MKILSFAPFQTWQLHHQLDQHLLRSVRLRGCDVAIVSCAGLFEEYGECILRVVDQSTSDGVSAIRTASQCQYCIAQSNENSAVGIRKIVLETFLTDQSKSQALEWMKSIHLQPPRDVKWGNWDIGQWVISSVFTRLKCLQTNTSAFRRIFSSYCHSGLLCAIAMEQILLQEKPDKLIIFNGRHAPYRIAMELGRLRQIPFLSHERGYIDDTFVVMNDETIFQKLLYSTPPAKELLDIPLSAKECLTVRNYLALREDGRGMNLPSFLKCKSEASDVRRLLGIPLDARVLAVFPTTAYELEAFSDADYKQNSCIEGLIREFVNRPEWLIIRLHPHLSGKFEYETDYPSIDYFLKLRAIAPPNVRFIMPDDPLNSYTLFDLVEAAISPYSSVTYESSSKGIPTAGMDFLLSHAAVAIISHTDAESLHDLVNQLLHKEELGDIVHLRRSYRLIHFLIHHYSIKFKSFGILPNHVWETRYRNDEDLLPGSDPTLDTICDGIVSGTPLPSVPRPCSDIEETEFLTEQLLSLKKKRFHLQQGTRRSRVFITDPPISLIHLMPDHPIPSGDTGLYKNIEHPQSPSIPSLLGVLARLSTPYVAFRESGMEYFEILLPSLLDILEGDLETKLDGARQGTWMALTSKGVYSELLTQRTKSAWRDTAPWMKHRPWQLLSLGLYRTSYMVDWLRKLQSRSAIEMAPWPAQKIFLSPSIAAPAIPMAVLRVEG